MDTASKATLVGAVASPLIGVSTCWIAEIGGFKLTNRWKGLLAAIFVIGTITSITLTMCEYTKLAVVVLILTIMSPVARLFYGKTEPGVISEQQRAYLESLRRLRQLREHAKTTPVTTRVIIGDELWARCESYVCDHRTIQLAERVQGEAVAVVRWVLSRFLFIGAINQELEFWLRRSIMNPNFPIDIKWCCTMIRYLNQIALVEWQSLPAERSIRVYLNGLLSGLDYLTSTVPERLTAAEIALCRSMLAELGTDNPNYWSIKGNLDRHAVERIPG